MKSQKIWLNGGTKEYRLYEMTKALLFFIAIPKLLRNVWGTVERQSSKSPITQSRIPNILEELNHNLMQFRILKKMYESILPKICS